MRNLFCTNAVLLLLALSTSCLADDFQLLYPDNNVSSRPILEFRARRASLESPSGESSATGHAFIFLGRELDNGTTVFYAAGGFMPERGTIKNILVGPGQVKYTIADMTNDEVFRVRITEDQEGLVKYIMENWNSNTYSVAWQNCVSLQRDIARAIGLQVPEFSITNLTGEFPSNFVMHLRQINVDDTPVRHAEREERRMEGVRDERRQELNAIQQRAYEAERRWEQRRRDTRVDQERRRQIETGHGPFQRERGNQNPSPSLNIEILPPAPRQDQAPPPGPVILQRPM